MSSERWERVKEIFEAALNEKPEQREPLIAKLCGEDESLRAEVASLLAAHEQAGGFLANAPGLEACDTDKSPEPPVFSPGEIVAGRFRVWRYLGRGGMGQVYEAEDIELDGIRIALKTVRPSIIPDSSALTRFKREIQLARRVTHPNVCRIFDQGRHQPSDGTARPEVIFLTMELLEGETLAARLGREGRMPPDKALPLVCQMAEALAAAHDVGVIHRDFKPANVMLVPQTAGNIGTPKFSEQSTESLSEAGAVRAPSTDSPRAVVMDFGLARAITPSITPGVPSLSFTVDGQRLGTPPYMAPEQLENRAVTPSTDIYALGLVIYEMVTGHRPFEGDTYTRLREQPPSPRTHAPGLDQRWESMILRCLERDPALRYASAKEVTEALTSSGTARRRRRVLAACLGGLLALLIAAAALVLVPGLRRVVTEGVKILQALVTAPPKSTRRVLVADFDNRTGEAVFDQTLRELFTTSLEQSKVLSIFPDIGLSEVLQRMRRPRDVRIDQSLGQEVCAREGLGAVVLGSIARIGGVYVLTVRAVTPHGDVLFSGEDRAKDQQSVLPAVDRLATRLLQELGESPEATGGAREPLEKVTSQSLEALRLFSQGKRFLLDTQFVQAQGFMERALEVDPSFAMAHEYLGALEVVRHQSRDGRQHLQRAVELVDRVTERERLKILGDYNLWVTQDFGKAINLYQMLLALYPEDLGAHANLAAAYENEFRFDLAAQETEKALTLAHVPAAYSNLAFAYFFAGQKKRAFQVAEDGLQRFPEAYQDLLSMLAKLSLADGNFDRAKTYISRMASVSDGGAISRRILADIEMSQGRYHAASTELQTALIIDEGGADSWAQAPTHLQLASLYFDLNDRGRAIEQAKDGARLTQEPEVLAWAASLLASAGDVTTAKGLLLSVEQAGWKPWIAEVQAEVLLAEGHTAAASRIVHTEMGYPVRTPLLETKARVLEGDHHFAEAVDVYKELLDRQSERAIDDVDGPAFHCVVTTYYHLGALYLKLGDIPKARVNLERYLGFASEADPDAPLVRDARDHLQRLTRSVPAKRHAQRSLPTPAA